jgi:hypothetical protein
VSAEKPGFSLAAIVTLALGIGVNAAIFSVVYGCCCGRCRIIRADRLVVLHQGGSPGPNAGDIPFSVHDIADYRGNNKTLDAVVEHHTMNFLLLGPDSAERVNTAVVSANFFDVLGVKPVHGRTFVADDEKHTADAVADPELSVLEEPLRRRPRDHRQDFSDEQPAAHGDRRAAQHSAVSGGERRVHAHVAVAPRGRRNGSRTIAARA